MDKLRKFCLFVFLFMTIAAYAQKKEIVLAKANVKAGKALTEAEASMRKLLNDSDNVCNEKIWLVLFDAVKKQYETINEQMYLKHTADTVKLFDTTYKLFGVLEGLDSVCVKTHNGVKAKLKYRKKHAEYLDTYRNNIFNGGLFFIRKQDYGHAWNFFDLYINCAVQPLFSDFSYLKNDKLMPKAAFYAVFCGYKQNDVERALRYSELAQADTAKLDLVYQYMSEVYRLKNDSTNLQNTLQQGFDCYPHSSYFFPRLFDIYFKRGDLSKASTLCDKALSADSLNKRAVFAKSSVMLALHKYDECIDLCNEVLRMDSTIADPYLNIGLAYYNQAVKIDNDKKAGKAQRAKMLKLYREAMPYMQKYRLLEKNAANNWALPLYTIYLNLNMGKEFEEIDKLLRQKEK